MRVLLVDHYDSFTWNLAHAIAGATGALPEVVAHDDPALLAWDWDAVDAVVLSPGPGHPAVPGDARHTDAALRPDLPVLGVCLGMQLLAHRAGARVTRAPEPRHGRVSPVEHVGDALFAGIPSPVRVVRYHSLACGDLPDTLVPTAWTADDDRVLMALRHRAHPWWGVQFHPESIASEHGDALVRNFLALAAARRGRGVAAPGVAASGVAASGVAARPAASRTRARAPAAALPPLVHRAISAPVDPVALHAAHFARAPSVWLDGAAAGTRFSLLGDASGPLAYTIAYRTGGRLTVRRRAGEETRDERLWDHLRAALAGPRPAPPEPAFPFALGFVGAFGYELRADGGSPVAHPAADADAELLFLDRAVLIDHAEGRVWLLALDHPENRAWLDTMEAAVTRGEGERHDRGALRGAESPAPGANIGTVTWRHDRGGYLRRIERAFAHLRDGESYELCLTNAARVPFRGDPVAAYRVLRAVNPAPFAGLLLLEGRALLSSSPERFLRVEPDGRVTAQPIKGTRRRGADPAADGAARADLAGAEKDRAENLMIVDLLRNDLGRVCAPGTVAVPVLFGVESYTRVHQMVSTVTGTLRADAGAVDVLEAAFPPGSMTGAPKLRTMALLDALEGAPRGLYSGAFGYLSLCGGADLSVVIRSTVIADGVATVGVGGAIVALSEPAEEVAEMELKAEAVLEALARASG